MGRVTGTIETSVGIHSSSHADGVVVKRIDSLDRIQPKENIRGLIRTWIIPKRSSAGRRLDLLQ